MRHPTQGSDAAVCMSLGPASTAVSDGAVIASFFATNVI